MKDEPEKVSVTRFFFLFGKRWRGRTGKTRLNEGQWNDGVKQQSAVIYLLDLFAKDLEAKITEIYSEIVEENYLSLRDC